MLENCRGLLSSSSLSSDGVNLILSSEISSLVIVCKQEPPPRGRRQNSNILSQSPPVMEDPSQWPPIHSSLSGLS